jgi:hypothetical protein
MKCASPSSRDVAAKSDTFSPNVHTNFYDFTEKVVTSISILVPYKPH